MTEEVKLEWMYKNRAGVADSEDYLLGKAIDKNFEAQSTFNEVDKDILPPSIFASADSNIQVDVDRKVKEDPLEQIRQKEIEMRRQLLKNPVKMKKLQNMIKMKAEALERKKLKKLKKKKKQSEIDKLLAEKYRKITSKLGIKNLSDLKDLASDSSDDDDDSKKKKKSKRKSSSSDSSSSSSSESSGDKQSLRKSMKKIGSSSSSSSSDEPSNRQSTSKRRYASSDDEKPAHKKIFGLTHPKGKEALQANKNTSNVRSYERRAKEPEKQPYKPQRPKKISEEEKEKKLREMMENAKWRDEQRKTNIKRYSEEDKKESTKEKEYSQDFMREQLALAQSHGDVEKRIKSKLNNIQRSSSSMNENFLRRH